MALEQNPNACVIAMRLGYEGISGGGGASAPPFARLGGCHG